MINVRSMNKVCSYNKDTAYHSLKPECLPMLCKRGIGNSSSRAVTLKKIRFVLDVGVSGG
eukprot:4211375-Pleurochrysis_carterae.AAC.2